MGKAERHDVTLRTAARSVLDGQVPTRVDALAQILAGLEVRNVLAGQRNGFSGLWISADSRWPEVQGKTAKPPDFNALAPRKGITHQVQQMLDR